MEGSRRRCAIHLWGESRADETRSLLFKTGLSSVNGGGELRHFCSLIIGGVGTIFRRMWVSTGWFVLKGGLLGPERAGVLEAQIEPMMAHG
jgi:hypothetical protein